VMEQVRLCISANVPLSPGFEMIARDGLEAYRTWSPEFATRMLKLAAFFVFIASAALGTLSTLGTDSPAPAIGAAKTALLCLWCYLSVYRRYTKPMAVFLSLKAHIDSGHTLSEAMARIPRFFPRNLIALVEVGERTGNLGEILDGFNDETVRSIAGQQELARTFRYLGANAIAIAAITAFALVKSVPVFVEILAELEAPPRADAGIWIPLPSLHTMMAITDFMIGYWYLPLAALLAGGALLYLWAHRNRRGWGGHPAAAAALAVPGLRGMVVWQNLGGAARLIQHLLAAGATLEQSIAMAARGDLHPAYRRWFERLRERVMQGETLEEACGRNAEPRLVPASFGTLLGTGERQGNLEETLTWIGEQYRQKLERRTRFLLGCVMPAGVFLLGYVVLSLEAALFHTLIAMADALLA